MDVTVATIFDAPRALVAAVSGDPDQAMRWYANIRSVRWRGPSELVEGARIDFVARFLGRQLAYTYVVVELVPQERMVMRTEDGPFPMETTYTWWDEEPNETGRPRTGMSVRNAGRPSAMTTLASGAVTLGMKRAMRRDLERLRLVLREEQDAPDAR